MNATCVYTDAEALGQAAADTVRALFHRIANGPVSMAVSGGSTPRRMFEILAEPGQRHPVPWERLRLFWVDERPVPPEHPDSNYGMTRRTLLDHVPLPESQVFPFRTGELPPGEAAEAYEAVLRNWVSMANGLPRFDLILLGMGDDGHTASLFPHSPALSENTRWVVANPVEKLGVSRLTLTFPVILNAAEARVLVSGPEKIPALRAVMEGPDDPETWPAQRLMTMGERLTWMLDTAAVGPSGIR